MEPTRAEWSTWATYVGNDADMPPLPRWPMLAISVTDFEEARDLVALIEKHRVPKKRKPRTSTKLPPAPKCIVAGCTFDADTFSATDSDLCRDHASATAEQKAAWRALKVTPPTSGKRKAAEIVRQLEGKPDVDASSTKTTALPHGPDPKAA